MSVYNAVLIGASREVTLIGTIAYFGVFVLLGIIIVGSQWVTNLENRIKKLEKRRRK